MFSSRFHDLALGFFLIYSASWVNSFVDVCVLRYFESCDFGLIEVCSVFVDLHLEFFFRGSILV